MVVSKHCKPQLFHKKQKNPFVGNYDPFYTVFFIFLHKTAQTCANRTVRVLQGSMFVMLKAKQNTYEKQSI